MLVRISPMRAIPEIEENHEIPQSGHPVFGPRFKPGTFRIWSRSVNHDVCNTCWTNGSFCNALCSLDGWNIRESTAMPRTRTQFLLRASELFILQSRSSSYLRPIKQSIWRQYAALFLLLLSSLLVPRDTGRTSGPSLRHLVEYYENTTLTTHASALNSECHFQVMLKLSRYTQCRRQGGEGPLLLILDLGTRWGWVVSVTPQPCFISAKRPRYPLDRDRSVCTVMTELPHTVLRIRGRTSGIFFVLISDGIGCHSSN
jgi:hypothetical protein